MLIIAGLGNPGPQYARNRHNIGFMAIDAMAAVHRIGPFRSRFQSQASEGLIASERILLLKPTTFMNDSGRAVGEALRFYKVGLESLVVLHDELDLAPAKLRMKVGGGNAGHNGLRSITAICGNDYRRGRLGIGHPGDKALVHGYVLSDFAKAERAWVDALCDNIARDAELLVRREDASLQNKVHLAMTAAGF
ncbi:aminoacyl-tRNA hydrolase [Lichenihabitans psoromatis]|uniref:aminoacyl-tRNA hydrolase n=1 Tax=Lichenihabitans psoromatis TaxID=2528642 RepID=UPI0010383AEB|nr:aminoacyl-tRNA hydrolase [Lichenihabitans psoromatis]